MLRNSFFLLLIICALTFSTISAQDAPKDVPNDTTKDTPKADEEKAPEIDFAVEQATPEKTFNLFAKSLRGKDFETLYKICVGDLKEQIKMLEQFSESDEFPEMYFSYLEGSDNNNEALVVAELVSVRGEKQRCDVEILPVMMNKVDEKWFITSIEDIPENPSEWIMEFMEILEEKYENYEDLREELYTNPYIMIYELFGTLAEKDKAGYDALVFAENDEAKKRLEKLFTMMPKGLKYKIKVTGVVEKDDYALVIFEANLMGEDAGQLHFIMKNVSQSPLKKWLFVPYSDYKTITSMEFPEWLKNSVKFWNGKTDKIEKQAESFEIQMSALRDALLAWDDEKLAKMLSEESIEMLAEAKEEIEKFTSIELIVYHQNKDQAIIYANIGVIELGDDDEEIDDMGIFAEFKDGKWLFQFGAKLRKLEDVAPWLDDIDDTWEKMLEYAEMDSPRPTKLEKENDDYYGPGYEPEEKPEDDDNGKLEINKLMEGLECGDYSGTAEMLTITEKGNYRITGIPVNTEHRVAVYVKWQDTQLSYSQNIGCKSVVDLYLVPGEYKIDVYKGWSKKKQPEKVAYSLFVAKYDNNSILPMEKAIVLDEALAFTGISSDSKQEVFYLAKEDGYYNIKIEAIEDQPVKKDTQIYIALYKEISKWIEVTGKIPSTSLIFLTKGLNRLSIGSWGTNPAAFNLTLSEAPKAEFPAEKTFDIKAKDEMGWQFKCEESTLFKATLKGSIEFKLLQGPNQETVQVSWGKTKTMESVLGKGTYLIKAIGPWSGEAKGVVLTFEKNETVKADEAAEIAGQVIGIEPSKPFEIDLSKTLVNPEFILGSVVDGNGDHVADATIEFKVKDKKQKETMKYVQLRGVDSNYSPSFRGLGYIYGFVAPAHYEIVVYVEQEYEFLSFQYDFGCNMAASTLDSFDEGSLSKNELIVCKIDAAKAMHVAMNLQYPVNAGNIQLEVWHQGFEQKYFSSWTMQSGISSRGLLCEGTYYVVLKRLDKNIWPGIETPEELPYFFQVLTKLTD